MRTPPCLVRPRSLVSQAVETTQRWTGGQYSLLRSVLGAVTVVYALGIAATGYAFLSVATLAASCAVLVGSRDRVAALVAAVFVLAGPDQPGWGALETMALGIALLLHAGTPPAPFGSWAAIGRTAPAGQWEMPQQVRIATWAAIAGMWMLRGLGEIGSAAWPLAVLEIAAPLLFATRQFRALAWTALLGVLVGNSVLGQAQWGLLILHMMAFEPAWLAPVGSDDPPDVVFYDGSCALCHGIVRFVLAEDPAPGRLRFAPLAGESFAKFGPHTAASTPDAIAVSEAGAATLLWRSDAVIRVCNRLGGVWRVVAFGLSLLPRWLRDAGYDVIASRRKSLFGSTTQACPLISPALRSRIET
ncbi:MAG: putative DCC family thiol-disulfide oxidoreductase YuxK [Hyphomicrobiaceae bacterium]|jgi:predicted DCC family thiol-disulfide oxidoreductase YuxK